MSHQKKNTEQTLLSISELADLLQIPKSTLRYYEAEHLITPVRTEQSNYRLYSDEVIVELTDIILYRNLGLSLKDIHTLMNRPAENTLMAIEKVVDETYLQIHELTEKLALLTSFEKRIHTYLIEKYKGYQIVKNIPILKLYSYSSRDPEFLQHYMKKSRGNCYAVYFPDAIRTSEYIDCIVQDAQDFMKYADISSKRLLWNADTYDCQYLQCVIRTEYSYTEINNIEEHLSYIKSRGFIPGFIVAKYLTFDYCEADQKRYDYYLGWIEICS